jgi:FkbM family methyltransferase
LPLQFKQNWTMLFEMFDDAHEGPALEAFQERALIARCVFDIGMNAGLYLYHAVCVADKGAQIVGFEPNEVLAGAVRKNIHSNGLANAEVVTGCCSDVDALVEVFVTNTDHMTSLESAFLRESGRPILGSFEAKAMRLDSFVRQRGYKVDLMKIDVEGHEDKVIAGAKETIQELRPTIIIEVADRNVEKPFLSDLFSLGYRCFYLLPQGRIEISSQAQLSQTRRPGFVNYLFSPD